MMAIEE